jgi:hypothetical protein
LGLHKPFHKPGPRHPRHSQSQHQNQAPLPKNSQSFSLSFLQAGGPGCRAIAWSDTLYSSLPIYLYLYLYFYTPTQPSNRRQHLRVSIRTYRHRRQHLLSLQLDYTDKTTSLFLLSLYTHIFRNTGQATIRNNHRPAGPPSTLTTAPWLHSALRERGLLSLLSGRRMELVVEPASSLSFFLYTHIFRKAREKARNTG